jgi:hypothetical protein
MLPSMKLLLLLLVVGNAYAQDVTQLSWMTGCWEQSRGSLTIEEQWTKPRGGIMLGVARTVKGDKAVETEFLKIAPEGGVLVYTPRIGNREPVPFKLLRISETEVVFENLTHDFPQRIIYRKQEGGLFARIENKEKGQDIPMKRASCQ